MRKHHLALGLGLALAVCAAPGRAHAKPQNAADQQVSRAKPLTTASGAPVELTGAKAKEPGVAKRTAATPAPPGDKASQTATLRSKTQAKKREQPPCLSPVVHLVRTRGDEAEPRELSLTFCDGRPNPSALDSLSVLGRPRDVERPLMPEIKAYLKLPVDKGPKDKRRDPAFLAPRVMRLHEGLLERLQKVTQRFPGKAIEIVSGYRPDARETSRHHHGRALDFRVEGVTRERLRDFLRTLEQTGVGYYPNSSFVHMDVRDDKGYWVDRSGPGEVADYGVWPPPKREIEQAQSRLLAGALAELGALGRPNLDGTRPMVESERRVVAARRPPVRDEGLRDEGDQMSSDEVRRIRADALKALQQLQ